MDKKLYTTGVTDTMHSKTSSTDVSFSWESFLYSTQQKSPNPKNTFSYAGGSHMLQLYWKYDTNHGQKTGCRMYIEIPCRWRLKPKSSSLNHTCLMTIGSSIDESLYAVQCSAYLTSSSCDIPDQSLTSSNHCFIIYYVNRTEVHKKIMQKNTK